MDGVRHTSIAYKEAVQLQRLVAHRGRQLRTILGHCNFIHAARSSIVCWRSIVVDSSFRHGRIPVCIGLYGSARISLV